MRALTIKQPWASAIAQGVKRIENRSWRPPAALVGKRIAIHAGLGMATLQRYPGGWTPPESLPRGAVVATAVIDRVVESSEDPWFTGPMGWVLRDIRPIKRPIPAKGALGLWEFTPGAK